MKKTTRRLLSAVLAAILCFSVFCTINDDNGSPVDPGNQPTPGGDGGGDGGGGGGGGGGATRVPTIIAENEYVGVGDTAAIVVTLLADTSRNAAPISGARVNVAYARAGDRASNPASLSPNASGQAILRFSGSQEDAAELTFTYNATT